MSLQANEIPSAAIDQRLDILNNTGEALFELVDGLNGLMRKGVSLLTQIENKDPEEVLQRAAKERVQEKGGKKMAEYTREVSNTAKNLDIKPSLYLANRTLLDRNPYA